MKWDYTVANAICKWQPASQGILGTYSSPLAVLSTLIYLTAMGLTGEPTARVIGNGGAQKKNS